MSLFSPFSILTLDSYTSIQGATLTTDEGLSNLVNSILPDYVVSDHPTFVSFVKAYFEFLSQEGNARFAATTLERNADIDQSLDSFIDYFKDQYLKDFPKILESDVNDRFLVKKIKNYYEEKGNPRSLDLLFRILFGVSSEVEFPRDKILVLSDAVADVRPKIVLTNYQGIVEYSKDESYNIKQTVLEDPTTGQRASAFLDDVRSLNANGTNFIHADLLDVQGNFSTNVSVQIFGATGDTNRENIVPLFSDLVIENGGTGYSRNETIVIKDSSQKIVETVKIKNVSSTGAITKVEKINQIIPDVGNYTITTESSGINAVLTLGNRTATIVKPRIFKSQKNLISSDSFIQDNDKYQQFSYLIKAEKSIFQYRDLIQKLFHPSGMKFFGQYNFQREFSLNTVTADSLAGVTGGIRVRPIIGHYFPYTMGDTFDLRGDTFGSTFADYYPTGFNGLTAATFGSFTADGRAITHDPFDGGNFVTGPLGGNTGGTFNPEFYSTGVTKPGYEPITQNQLRMTFADSVTAPFFTIFRHPKNMNVENTIFPDDAALYASGEVRNTNYFLTFDSQYQTIDNPHSFTGVPSVGDIVIQRNIDIPEIAAFGEVTSLEDNLSTDYRFQDPEQGNPPAAGRAFRVKVKTFEGDFSNVGYERFSRVNQNGFCEFISINASTGVRTISAKRFIAQAFLPQSNLFISGTEGASFEFQDIKCGDFFDNMTFLSLGITGTSADRGISFGQLTP